MGRKFKILWVFSMASIVSPAFFVAGYTEGATLAEARFVAEKLLLSAFCPEALAPVFSLPVAMVSMFFPSTALVAQIPGLMLGDGIAAILITTFFITTYYPVRPRRERSIAEELQAAGL